jgi:iron complex transport system substrate-binding protein
LGALAVFAICFFAQKRFGGRGDAPASASQGATSYKRIVSLAPSITETLFALGLGDAIVGVTRYCDYPPEATSKPQVGGYYDPNYEAILAQAPDLVILLPEHEKPRQYLTSRGLRVLTVDHRTVEGILDSIRSIGRAGGAADRAEAMAEALQARMDRIAALTRGLAQPRVMVVVGRDVASSKIEDVYIAGRAGLYDQLVELAGGVNAFEGDMAFPTVSAEGILNMDPEVIVEMLGDMSGLEVNAERTTMAWQSLPQVNAVKHGRVHLFCDDFVVVPGPRFIQILEKLAGVLHPELDWGKEDEEGQANEPPRTTVRGNANEDASGGPR